MQGINAFWKNITFPANKYMEFSKSQQQWKQSNQPYIILSMWAPATFESNFAFSSINMPQIINDPCLICSKSCHF